MRNLDSRLHPRTLAGYGLLLGAAMIATAWLWMVVIRRDGISYWFPASGWFSGVMIGAGVGIVAAALVIGLLDRLPAFQAIEEILFNMLDMESLRFHHAAILGLVAGIPEEILFRGALQPTLGLLFTSVIFGALHSITPVYFLYACCAGLLLGGLHLWLGSLWAPVAAHTMIDLLMFMVLIRHWRQKTA
jgi:uncharacterized protein